MSQRLQDDLDAQYQRRQAYAQLFNTDPITQLTVESIEVDQRPTTADELEFQDTWIPSRTVTTLLAIAVAFAAGLGYEVIRHAYRWLYSLFS